MYFHSSQNFNIMALSYWNSLKYVLQEALNFNKNEPLITLVRNKMYVYDATARP